MVPALCPLTPDPPRYPNLAARRPTGNQFDGAYLRPYAELPISAPQR